MKTKFEVSVEITPEMVEMIAEKLVERGDCVFVVRCKDCKRYEMCRTINVWAVKPGENWFCADGERKDDAEIH